MYMSSEECNMKKMMEYIESCDSLENLILVSIVSASGSTPRKAGAMMIVGKQGLMVGTIGGGLLEYECVKKAQEFLGQDMNLKDDGTHNAELQEKSAEREPSELQEKSAEWQQLEHFELDNTKAGALGMICGGNADVLFQNLTHSVLCNLKEKAESIQEYRVILVGGGHVALAVSQLLQFLDFPYIVVEDREEFGQVERFPKAQEIVIASYEKMLDTLAQKNIVLNSRDAVCIMTRGHAGDTHAIRYALQTDAGYIGLMGSPRKSKMILSQLEQEGFQEAREKVTTPIGMDIGGQTPEELAVSIVGQLIAWRAGK